MAARAVVASRPAGEEGESARGGGRNGAPPLAIDKALPLYYGSEEQKKKNGSAVMLMRSAKYNGHSFFCFRAGTGEREGAGA